MKKILHILFLLSPALCLGQTCLNTTETYPYPTNISGYSACGNAYTSNSISGGLLSDNGQGTLTVTWIYPGPGYVRKSYNTTCPPSYGGQVSFYIVNSNVNVLGPPATPPVPFIQSHGCGTAVLAYTGTPAAPVVYYWQTSPTGTAMTNSSPTYTGTQFETYYLRAYNTVCCTWSAAATSVTVPQQVRQDRACSNAGPSTITYRSNFTTDKWYDAPTGGTLVYTGNIFEVPKTDLREFFVESVSCGAVRKAIKPTFMLCDGDVCPGQSTPVPVVNDSNFPFTITSSSWEVSGGTFNAGQVTWGSTAGVGILTRKRTFVVYGNTYTTSTPIQAFYVGGYVPPAPPTPTVSFDCNAAMLSFNTLPPDRETWYWQDTSTGTSTENSATTMRVRGLKTYYLRAKSLCHWGATSASLTLTADQFVPCNIEPKVTHITTNVSGLTGTPAIDILDVQKTDVSVTYFDGLGRAAQSVSVKASPLEKDIVSPVVYDALGREARKYLPYVSSDANGKLKTVTYNATGDYTHDFYDKANDNIVNDNRPFSETTFESSPLSRPLKQYGPGEAWGPESGNKYAAYSYTSNIYTPTSPVHARHERIIAWAVNYTTDLPIRRAAVGGEVAATGGYYLSSQLQVSIARDEQNNEIRQYTDRNGKMILKKVQAVASPQPDNKDHWAQTYYIYDDFGQLRFVLPPELTRIILQSDTYLPTTTELGTWAFQYKYDAMGRKTISQVPGAGAVYMVYDNLDRVVLTQDGNQRALASKEWTFVKYDAFNRPILTGRFLSNSTLATVQSAVNTYYSLPLAAGKAWFETYVGAAAGNVLGYENKSFPTVSALTDYYSATYYDRYDTFIAPAGYTYVNESLTGQAATSNTAVKGLVTGSYIKNLATGTWMRAVSYYDARYRAIQSIGDHQKGTLRTSMVYDFPGKVLITKRTYVINAVTTTIKETFAYDYGGRLLNVKHSINGAADVMTTKNEYNELGQPVDKKLHSTDNGVTFKQSVDYLYNIRGWLSKINEADVSAIAAGDPTNDYFGMELAYNGSIPGLASTPSYNGNISAVQWSKGNGGTVRKQAYSYTYDNMNRLKDANHFDHEKNISTGLWQFNSNSNGYGENLTYDFNGNILTLLRKGFKGASMDNLTYNYTGNQLNYVHDAADATAGFVNGNTGTDDYSYDSNGNIDKDKNKGLITKGNIKYNHLNLPIEIIKGTEKVKYIYDASGKKLAQEVYNTSGILTKTTDYIGELIYEGDVLKFAQTSEGRILKNGAAWEYQYHLKDHLGNVRVTFTSKAQTATNYTTNFEAATNANFQNYSTHTNDVFDHTDVGTVYQKSQRLLGTGNSRVGLAKSIPVMPGDQVSATAFVKYWNLSGTANTNVLITSLATAFGVSSTSTGEQLKIFNGLNNYAGTVLSGDHPLDDDNVPKAFVTILFFDKNYNLLDAAWDQVSTTGATAHDQITTSAKAPEAGYAYIFLSNEHQTAVEVYFDDFTLTHTPSPIVGVSDYYPFGLSFNNSERTGTGTFEQKYLYNGKELQDELSLNWYDYGARMYMPELGRWGAVDPLAENSRRWSPYHYAYDNPIRYIDPDGMMSEAYRGGMGGMESMEEDETDRQRRDLINSVNRALEGGGNTVATKESSTESGSSGNTSSSPVLSYNSKTRERREAAQAQQSPNPTSESVNFFGSKDDNFNGVAYSGTYEKEGDGNFTVFGHGAPGYLIDDNTRRAVKTAGGFDILVSETNSNWNKLKDRPGTNLAIYSCSSAVPDPTTGKSLAQQISAAHPNITVTGAQGYCQYEKMWWGGYRITGINVQPGSGLNDGYLITYKNGKAISTSRFK